MIKYSESIRQHATYKISLPKGNWIQLQFKKEELTCYNSKTLREIHRIAQCLRICSEKELDKRLCFLCNIERETQSG